MTQSARGNGRYANSFFYLCVDEKVELDDSNNIKLTGTLAHEYCHFLQDITTTVGLMGIIEDAYILRYLIHTLNWDKNKSYIIVPPYDLQLIKHQVFMSEFSGDLIKPENNIEVVDYRVFKSNFHSFYDMCKLELSNGKTTNLGSFILFESMAKSLELSLFPTDNIQFDYPYMICRKLIKKIHKDFNLTYENVLALCDASLMHPNPGIIFIKSLEAMQNQGIILDSMREIYEFIEEEKSLQQFFSPFGKGCNLHYTNAYCAIMNFYKHTGFGKKWALRRLEKASSLRISCPRFWISILSKTSSEDKISAFNDIMQQVGYPIVYDKSNKVYDQSLICEEEIFNYNTFAALNSIYNILACGETGCLLYRYCSSNNSKNIVSQHCLCEPWKQVNNDNMCPFAIVWKKLALPTNVYRVFR
ncbi:MAG TPA: hypothetical protein GX525_02900 [Bacilli bacterium]|nr:hypothetical protein [Bacilli bacterium]